MLVLTLTMVLNKLCPSIPEQVLQILFTLIVVWEGTYFLIIKGDKIRILHSLFILL